MDNQGDAAEVDSDSDGGNTKDGNEDINHDGDQDAGERNPFRADDDVNPPAPGATDYFYQGTSPPLAGPDGSGESWATLEIERNGERFRFRSGDQILGNVTMSDFAPGKPWNDLGLRIVFRGTGDDASISANVLTEPYLRADVDVVRDSSRVRYLLKQCTPNP